MGIGDYTRIHNYKNIRDSNNLLVWVFQTGEPLHIDGNNARPMRAMNLSNALVQSGHRVVLWSSAFYHQESAIEAPMFKYQDFR
jgi:hypothetical protein